MARRESTPLRHALSRLCSKPMLERLAGTEGLVRRNRCLDPVAFFWVLVLTVGTGGNRTLADLRRAYARVTGDSLEASSFYARFSPALTGFLKKVLSGALGRLASSKRSARVLVGEIAAGLICRWRPSPLSVGHACSSVRLPTCWRSSWIRR